MEYLNAREKKLIEDHNAIVRQYNKVSMILVFFCRLFSESKTAAANREKHGIFTDRWNDYHDRQYNYKQKLSSIQSKIIDIRWERDGFVAGPL